MFSLAEMRKRTTATGCKMTTNVPALSTQYKPSLGQNKASRKRSGSKVFHVKCQSVLNVLQFYIPTVSRKTQKAVVDLPCFCRLQLRRDIWLAEVFFHDQIEFKSITTNSIMIPVVFHGIMLSQSGYIFRYLHSIYLLFTKKRNTENVQYFVCSRSQQKLFSIPWVLICI